MSDISEVYQIERMLFQEPWSETSFIENVGKNELSYSFVIEKSNSVIGYSVCWYYLNELHIGNLAIHPDFQGKGYGKYLLSNIFQSFKNYKIAYLEVRVSNLIAINLYEKFGFRKLYNRNKYYSNSDDAIVMVKNK